MKCRRATCTAINRVWSQLLKIAFPGEKHLNTSDDLVPVLRTCACEEYRWPAMARDRDVQRSLL